MFVRLRVLIVATAVVAATGAVSVAGERPSVVFLLIDDLGYADVGFNGGTVSSVDRFDAAKTSVA